MITGRQTDRQTNKQTDSVTYGGSTLPKNSLHDSYSSTGYCHQSTSSTDSYPQGTSGSLFLNCSNQSKSIIVSQHTKLQRTGVNKTKVIKPKVTFSELNDIKPSENNNHQKLSRSKDVTISFSRTNPNMDTENTHSDDYAYAYR